MIQITAADSGGLLYKKMSLKTCRPQPATLLKKQTVVEVLSCEFYKIFKNTYFTQHP